MNPGDSQIADWSRGGHTVPGGLDDLGRKVPRLTALDPAFFDTQPAPMDADQLRRDLIASQCQAPRIPRKRSPILSADSPDGTSRQGRDIPTPTSPVDSIDEDIEYHRRWWFVMIVLFAIACAFALAGCGGGGDDEQQGGTATVQPVKCAASGCAK